MLNASIENLAPKYLWLLRWAAKIAGCKLTVWKKRNKREKGA